MPLPGPLVHQQLMEAYTGLQNELSKVRTTIIKSGQERTDLDQERDDALLRLAEYYLPELTPDAVRETWKEVRGSITQILRRKEDHAGQIKSRLDTANGERGASESRLLSINSELDEAVESQKQIMQQIEQTLRQDSKFAELSDRAALAEVALERAEANLAEIDQDAARKLPAYEQSSLFQYLYKRNYSTPKYSYRGLTRQFDRMLARYIGFQHAKKGYEFLRRTPDHMRGIIADDRDSLDTVMMELERRRDEIADSHGLSDANQKCRDLERERDQLIERLDELRVDVVHIQSEWADLDDPRGNYYRQAIQHFREMLSKMSSKDLKRRAEKSREITDDQIVARLLGVETDIEQMDRNARRRQSQVKDDYVFLEELGRLIQRFRAAQFDSARSQFVDSFDLHSEVNDSREDVNIERLWKRLRRAQRWTGSAGQHYRTANSHPFGQMMMDAMAYAAGNALGEHARRAGKRYGESWKKWSEGFGSWDEWSWGDDSDDDRKKRRRRRKR
ncbi:MAG: hypothetical protein AAGG48_00400 [Planctomycetota bacterium]